MNKKFRAWDLSDNTPIHNDFLNIRLDGTMWCYDEDGDGDEINIDDSKICLEQWTGLTDKNGIDIFDGDIIYNLDSKNFRNKFLIIYDEKLCGFCLATLPERNYIPKSRLDASWFYEFNLKYLGNIHQNNELLK